MMHSKPMKSEVILILLLVCCIAALERSDVFVLVCTQRSEVCESSGSSTPILELFTLLLNFSRCCSALLQCFQNKKEHRKQILKFKKT